MLHFSDLARSVRATINDHGETVVASQLVPTVEKCAWKTLAEEQKSHYPHDKVHVNERLLSFAHSHEKRLKGIKPVKNCEKGNLAVALRDNIEAIAKKVYDQYESDCKAALGLTDEHFRSWKQNIASNESSPRRQPRVRPPREKKEPTARHSATRRAKQRQAEWRHSVVKQSSINRR